MLSLVVRDLQPVVEECAWKFLGSPFSLERREADADINSQIDGPQFDIGSVGIMSLRLRRSPK